MKFDYRKFSLISLKCLFILASISILLSIYWLRPLMNEGARYTFTFIQNMSPFSDNANFRFLLVPFQIPSLMAMKFIPDIEPLLVVRLYFYTLYIPLIFCLTYIFLRLKEEKEIFIAALVFFVVFLPGMNFQLSHINETLVIFILSVFCAYRLKLIAFSFLSFIAILGHPAVIGPYILLLFFLIAEIYHFKRHEFRKILYINVLMISLLLLKTFITLMIFPGLSGNYLGIFFLHLKEITYSRQDFITASYLLTSSVLVNYIPRLKKISPYVWILSSSILIFFISRERDHELHHLSYHYRVFSVSFFCLIMLYAWAVLRLNVRPVNSPYAYAFLIILASWFTVRDIKSTLWFREVGPELLKNQSQAGCHYSIANTAFIHSSLPVLKIFLDNRRKVESVLYSEHFDPDKKLCSRFNQNKFPYQISPNGRIHHYSITSEGFFSISPMKKKD